jgi:hypothetical protein
MFARLCARLTRPKIEQRSALLTQLCARPTDYRLVGYATTPDDRRLRLYVNAEAPVTAGTAIFAQGVPGRFDYSGQPMELRPAPEELARTVRTYLLHQEIGNEMQDATFQPAV